jgi:Lon protease-like protein
MPLYLHIFEPRYRQMIGECVRESRPFGVVLIRSGSEVGSSAEIYSVGTTATITHVRRLEGGEMDIATVGTDRFRVLSTHNEKPYLTGIVEDFPLDQSGTEIAVNIARRVGATMQRYLNIFATLKRHSNLFGGVGDVDLKLEQMPDDPTTLAYLTAFVLNMPMKDKQQLIEIPDLLTLLRTERKMLYREAEILKLLVENGLRYRDDPRVFSVN